MKRFELVAVHVISILIMTLALAGAAAQHGAQAKYRIAGKLVNAATGDPIMRGTVSLLAEGDSHPLATTLTDDEGRFSIDGLAADKYQLTAAKRGYLSGFYDEHEEYSSAVVTGSRTGSEAYVKVEQLTFKLVPGGVIYGVVTDDGGDPVEGASVRLYQKSHDHGLGTRILAPAGAKTDDTGAFEFGGLAPGEYMIAVTARPWYALARGSEQNEESSPLDVAYPVTYYDSTTEEAAASVIDVEGGSHVEANVTMHAVPALHITMPPTGKDSGEEDMEQAAQLTQMIFGEPAENEMLIVAGSRSVSSATYAGIAPGEYTIEAGDPPRRVSVELANSQQIDTSNGVAETSVSGVLHLLSGKPLKEQLTLVLEPGSGTHAAVIQQTGSTKDLFDFEQVPPGNWTLWAANGNKTLATVAITVNGKKTAGGDITVTEKPVQLDVTLADELVRVTGLVQKDGKGFPGAMVVLVPQNPAALHALVRRDQSDTDGTFNLRDVAPGRYTVLAIEDGWSLDWAKPGVVDRYLKSGIKINVGDYSSGVVALPGPVPVQQK
jgi:hypothetical protein